jgi:hypothetical protein
VIRKVVPDVPDIPGLIHEIEDESMTVRGPTQDHRQSRQEIDFLSRRKMSDKVQP